MLSKSNLYIDPVKLKEYLLNMDHIDGRSKAKLLISFGFSSTDIDKLHQAILGHVNNTDVKLLQTTFGDKFIVEGDMVTPVGKSLKIRSVWIKEKQEEIIKFVTLYPI